jgi:hypothetical protein
MLNDINQKNDKVNINDNINDKINDNVNDNINDNVNDNINNNINNNICNNNKKGNFENFEEGEILTLNTEEEKEKNCAKKEKEMIDERHRAPTLEEINDYIEKKGFTNVIGVQFFSHYKATGWKTTGGAKIINWRAKVDSWEYSDITKRQANGNHNNSATEPRRDVKPEDF